MPLDREVMAEFRRRRQAGLYAVAVELTTRAKVLATKHVDNGTRRNSITQTRAEDGSSVLWGIPLASAPHAEYLEYGFKPHWVPARYIGLWMQRRGVGVSRQTLSRSGRGAFTIHRTYKTVRSVAMGLYVGGPGSRLQSAPGGTSGYLFAGHGKRARLTWTTQGGESTYLKKGTVGHPILQPIGAEAHTVPLDVYRRGFERG